MQAGQTHAVWKINAEMNVSRMLQALSVTANRWFHGGRTRTYTTMSTCVGRTAYIDMRTPYFTRLSKMLRGTQPILEKLAIIGVFAKVLIGLVDQHPVEAASR